MSTEDVRPNFTITRCCRTCHYMKLARNNIGVCNLPKVLDPKAKALVTGGTCVCDAHTWKKNRHTVQKPATLTGAKLPDDAI